MRRKKMSAMSTERDRIEKENLDDLGPFFLNDAEREGITDPLSLSLRTMERKKARK